MTARLAVVLHGAVAPDARPDERDTLLQVEAVAAALDSLGYAVEPVALTLDLAAAAERLRALKPAFVFNLVEAVAGRDALLPLGPMLLDSLGIPYTGCRTRSLFATTDKLLAKRLMRAAGIPTPDWVEACPPSPDSGRFIVKSASEHASFGLDAASIVDAGGLAAALADRRARFGGAWFAEAYIDGREFNLSLLAGSDGPEILPPAEIVFAGFAPDEPRILGYAAKWDEDSALYRATPRRADFGEADRPLLDRLAALARTCWRLFGLSGYARVDFRVDARGEPHVLEVNANPCLSPGAGFMAAAERAGLGAVDVIARIVADSAA